MELTLLTVPACPHAAAFEERLDAALASHPGAVVRRRVVADEREAAEAGMRGSPTLLIDGVDPFAQPGPTSPTAPAARPSPVSYPARAAPARHPGPAQARAAALVR